MTVTYDAMGRRLRTIETRNAPSQETCGAQPRVGTGVADKAASTETGAEFPDKMKQVRSTSTPCSVAFGPEMPDWGSWVWVGEDLATELSKYFGTVTFRGGQVPDCDVAVFVKHAPSRELVEEISKRAAVVYCPVDYYGNAAAIDADAAMLRRCSRIIVHCDRLRRYFEPYAPVAYMDHHAKFAAPGHGQESWVRNQESGNSDYILWVGVRTNLPPLVEWVNEHALPCELRVLTNFENLAQLLTASDIGFRTDRRITVENWTPERHIALTSEALAAIDIKGDDFRSRHKPPVKAIDFIASGVPLAMNPDSSTVEHLASMGFEVASPLDTERWFSREYWEETRRFGAAVRELLSLERIGRRWKRIIEEVKTERREV